VKLIRWTPAVLLFAVAVALLVVVVVPWAVGQLSGSEPEPSQSAPGAPSASPSLSASAVVTPEPMEPLRTASFVGPAYDVNLVDAPTTPNSQAKMWFLDGSWWAVLVSEQSSQVSIHELLWDSQRWVDTGVLVDDRLEARHDAVWDGARLHVAGSGHRTSSAFALRVSTYSYDPQTRRYQLNPDSPRQLTPAGVDAPTMAVAADGTTWLAFTLNRDIYVARFLADTGSWSLPAPLAVDQGGPAEIASIASGGGAIVIAWTSLDEDELHVAVHRDGDPEDVWATDSTALEGLSYGLDELTAGATDEGAVVVAVRTSLDRVENRNLDAPQIVLVQFNDGDVRQAVVSRVRDGHTGPALVVDDARDEVYVIAAAQGGVYTKRARLEDLSFPTGLGTLTIAPIPQAALPSAPAQPTAAPSESQEPVVPQLRAPSTTHQQVAGLSEIVVIAADDQTARYGHGVIALADTAGLPDAAGHLVPLPEGVQVGLPPGAVTFAFRDSFSAQGPGPATLTGWQTREEPAAEVLSVGEPTAGDPSLRLTPNAAGEGPRACKQFAGTATGVVFARATVQLRGSPTSDTTITGLRSDGVEVTSVRFGEPGTFRYFAGDQRVTTATPFQTGVWYQSLLSLDLGSQTYDWQLTSLDSGQVVVNLADVALRAPAPVVDEICVQSGNELSGGVVDLYVDDVSVAIGSGS